MQVHPRDTPGEDDPSPWSVSTICAIMAVLLAVLIQRPVRFVGSYMLVDRCCNSHTSWRFETKKAQSRWDMATEQGTPANVDFFAETDNLEG